MIQMDLKNPGSLCFFVTPPNNTLPPAVGPKFHICSSPLWVQLLLNFDQSSVTSQLITIDFWDVGCLGYCQKSHRMEDCLGSSHLMPPARRLLAFPDGHPNPSLRRGDLDLGGLDLGVS